MSFQNSETRNYDALISTTLENWAKGCEDQVTSSMFLWYMLKRKGSWKSISGGLGERVKFTLRTDNKDADSYDGYDVIDTTPMNGITAAFYAWCQIATSVTISHKEERQNAGEYQMVDLLDEKTGQAMDGIKEKFVKMFLQGNGINSATAITTPYTSPLNGSQMFAPLPLLVGLSPTAGTVGTIPCNSTNESGVNFWANKQKSATDTNFASFFDDLTGLRNDCTKGIGGAPDMHLVDQNVAQFYEKALRSFHHNTNYARADIPFDNVAFHGAPVVWDEFMSNWSGATTVLLNTQGTWVMLNSKYIQMKYDSETNFQVGPFIQPENQTAKTAIIDWMGTIGVNQRRKHGVLSDINTTLTS